MKITFEIPDKGVKQAKEKSESTVVIDLLKRHGVPGKRAARWYQNYGPDYIVRKCLEFDYAKSKNWKPGIGWFTRNVELNYVMPEDWHDWLKAKKEQIFDSDLPQELKKIVGRL